MAVREAKKPPSFKDVRGNVVAIGSRVAYNFSGDVAAGTVVSVTNSNVRIQRDLEWTSQYTHMNPAPEYSNVKNRRGILVIHENGKIGNQIAENRRAIEAAYNVSLDTHKQRLDERERRMEAKITDLIKCVINAWDLDEVKDKLIELYGEDVLKLEEEIPDWLLAALEGTNDES